MRAFLRVHWVDVLVLTLAAVALTSVYFATQPNDGWDDAYITYRYGKNLAEGYGITWNPGEAPTQGYTTLTFVLTSAAGLAMGIHPAVTALVLNTLGLVLVLVSARFLLAQLLPEAPLLALMATLSIVFIRENAELLLNGMETVFWTGVVFLAAANVLLYAKTRHRAYLIAVFGLSFLGALTRPDTILFAGVWFLGLLVVGQRRDVLVGIGLFTLAGLAYLGWLYSHFGHILPNTFYVKVPGGGNLPGASYIIEYVWYWGTSPGFLLGVAALPLFRREKLLNVLPYAVFLLLIGFYLSTEPYAGAFFRFLHPATCLITVLAAAGIARLMLLVAESLQERVAGSPRLLMNVVGVVLIAGLFYSRFSLWLVQTADRRGVFHVVQPTDDPLIRTSLALGEVPEMENATIAHPTAGYIAYYSGAAFIDTVGLNNGPIARNAPQGGPEWVIDYTLAQEPDLIGFYSYLDGQIPEIGDGIMGPHYGKLYADARFRANYERVAGVDYGWAVVNWFARDDSPYAEPLAEALAPVAMENPPELAP